MPISSPASYLPTTDQFLTHWGEAQALVPGGTGLVLSGNIALDDLADLRDQLEARRDAVTDAGIDRSLARETLNALITRLQSRLVEFNARVRADLANTTYARVLATAFSVGDAEDSVREGLRSMRALWGKINAITPAPAGVALPLVLMGGYGLAPFEADMVALRTAYKALTEADQALRLAREQRNDTQDAIYAVLKAYRLKIPTVFPAESAIAETLPALTPAPGHTPSPVTAQGVWDAANSVAKLTWSASSEATLDHYEIRAVAGDDYISDDETVLASIEPTAPREFTTNFALSIPGLTAGFKVYVVLKTGNEAGSEAIYVRRG